MERPASIPRRRAAAAVSPDPLEVLATRKSTMATSTPADDELPAPPPGVPEIQLAMWRTVLERRARQIRRLPNRYLQSYADEIRSDLARSRRETNEYSEDLEDTRKETVESADAEEDLFEEVDHGAGSYSTFFLTERPGPTDVSADRVVLHLLALAYRSMDDRLPSAMRKHGVDALRGALHKLKATVSKWETQQKRRDLWKAKMEEKEALDKLVANKKKKMEAKVEYDRLLDKYKARRGFNGIELVKNSGMWYNGVQVFKSGESWGEYPAVFSLGDLLVSEAAMASDFATRLDLSLRKMDTIDEKLAYLRGLLTVDPPDYVDCSDTSIPWLAYKAAKSGSGRNAEPFNFHNPSAVKKERRVEIKARRLSEVNLAFTSSRKLELFHGVVKGIITALAPPQARG